MGLGKVAVIANNPEDLLDKTKIEWQELEDRGNVSIRFSHILPNDLLDADITFATAGSFSKACPICQLLFITCPVVKQELSMITSWMPKGSTVILYNFKP